MNDGFDTFHEVMTYIGCFLALGMIVTGFMSNIIIGIAMLCTVGGCFYAFLGVLPPYGIYLYFKSRGNIYKLFNHYPDWKFRVDWSTISKANHWMFTATAITSGDIQHRKDRYSVFVEAINRKTGKTTNDWVEINRKGEITSQYITVWMEDKMSGEYHIR